MLDVRLFARAMDPDGEETLVALVDEEVNVAVAVREGVSEKENLTILVALIAMISVEDRPIIGGSVPGHRKSKPRQRMEGYCMLYADYFVDDPLLDDVIFHRHFRMSGKHFFKDCREFEGDQMLQTEETCHRFAWFLHNLEMNNRPLWMLAYGMPGDTHGNYHAWPSPQPLITCIGSAG
jgi:hypothetical protein